MAKLDLAGGATGAASGAAVGSTFGPIGTAVGAVGGGLLGLFGRKKKKAKKVSTLDKNQQKLYNEYYKGVMGKGGQFGDLFNFNADQARDVFNQNVANPAYQNYNENIVPGITGSFRGQNLQNSSYLGGALANAGRDVQKNLDAQLANMLYQGQQDSVERRINALNNILNTQTFAYKGGGQTGTGQAFNALTDLGGKALGGYIDQRFAAKPSGSNVSTSGGG